MDEQESLWAARMIAHKQQAEKALADGARVVLELTAEVAQLKTERDALLARLQAREEVINGLEQATRTLGEVMGTSTVERGLAARVDDLELERRGLAERVADLTAERDQLKAKLDALVSKPEPAPRAGGELVTPRVLAWLATQAVNVGDEAVARAVALVRARDAFGRLKYEQGLSLEDGRDTVEDLKQELGDALQYGVKALIEGVEGERLEELRDLAQLLWLLMCADNVKVGGGR